jgi:hypothetical protein
MPIFGSKERRRSILEEWQGLWIDKNGKQLSIESTIEGIYKISVLDNYGIPFKIELLDKKTITTIGLAATFREDFNGYSTLQVEAGTIGVGPTYNLYFMTIKKDNELRFAKDSDDLFKIIIRPTVGMGLYDDFEDDLGVPWAFPLEDFNKYLQANFEY